MPRDALDDVGSVDRPQVRSGGAGLYPPEPSMATEIHMQTNGYENNKSGPTEQQLLQHAPYVL